MIYLQQTYLRNRKTKEKVLADWESGLDFKITGGGPYCSKRDKELMIEMYGGITILFGICLEERLHVAGPVH